MLAGIDQVTNPIATRRSVTGETDDELRGRARGALHGRVRGTFAALRFGLLSLRTADGAAALRDVQIVEMPNGVPGEVRVDVAYADDSALTRQRVLDVIEDIRPVGVKVWPGEATRVRARVDVTLTLSGPLPPVELQELQRAVEARLHAVLTRVEAGGRVRRARLAAAALEDARVVDARIEIVAEGRAPAEEIALTAGQVLDVVRPFGFPLPEVEARPGAPAAATTARVDATLPIHLRVGVSAAQAGDLIRAAVAAHLAGRRPGSPLTLGGLAAAIRDDQRYVLVRADALIAVEADGRFVNLTDGIGSFDPATLQSLELGTITIDVREGHL